jgi:hypothetical protein
MIMAPVDSVIFFPESIAQSHHEENTRPVPGKGLSAKYLTSMTQNDY